MFPVIFRIGPFALTSLGVCLALAFFFGGFEFWKRAKEEHFDDQPIFDLFFFTTLTGLIGARLLHILFNFSEYNLVLIEWLKWKDGRTFSWIGFMVGWMYGVRLYSKRQRQNFFFVADLAVFGLVVANIFIRLGQFLDGSYVGIPVPIGLHFPGLEGARYPLQLYEVIIFILVFLFLKWLDRHYRLFEWYKDNRGEARPGFLFLTYLLFLSVVQFSLDFLAIRETIFWVFSVKQLFLLASIPLILAVFWFQAGNRISVSDWGIVKMLLRTDETPEPIRPPISSETPPPRKRKFQRSMKA